MLGAGRLLAALAAMPLAAIACTPAQYASWADKDAYLAIKQGQKAALTETHSFDITYSPITSTQPAARTITFGDKTIYLGEGPTTILTLDDSLTIALHNSRSFQTQKESLYTAALAVMNGRRGWDWPLLDGNVTGNASAVAINDDGTTYAGAASVGPTLTQKLRHGGMIALAASLGLATDFTTWRNATVGSVLSANYTQPLLRGAWADSAYEPQYRLERNLIISIYGYERFTQTFATGIVTDYYSVLQQRDRVENDVINIRRLKETAALTKVLVEGGQSARIEQDQADQNLLDAQVLYQQDLETYHNKLDQFKITLGLPIAASVELDYPAALQELNKAGPQPMKVDETAAVDIALQTRPDVLTQAAQLRDAQRNVELAADNFLPELNAQLSISAVSEPPHNFTNVQFDRHTRSAGLTLNYPLDQTDNRDNYRNAVIASAKARRDLDEFLDTVRLQVRESYRSLMQARTSYDLQARSVEIANRRTKLAALQQKEGQATARDVLEAETALLAAKNGLTSALVQYTTTRLSFLATLGMLWIDEKGLIHERDNPFKFDAIQRRYPYVAQK